MSILVMVEVFKRDFKTASRKLLAIRLADFANDEGCGIWPSVDRLVLETQLSRRTVQGIMREFVAEGILTEIDITPGPRKPRRYDFNLAKFPPLLEPNKGAVVAPIDQNKGAVVAPIDPDKGATDDIKGATDDQKGRSGCAQTIIEPPDNHHSLHAREAQAEKPPSEREKDSDGIEKRDPQKDPRFWQAFKHYPRFNVSPKTPMLQAWSQLSEADQDQITEDRVSVYLDLCKEAGRDYPPAISTVLNDRLLFDVAIEERLARKREAKTDEGQALNMFGKAWMHARLFMLQKGAADIPPGTPEFKADRLRFPFVYRLDHGPLVVLEGNRIISDAALADYVTVQKGSDDYGAWEAHHRINGWPWINPPEHIEAVWFPTARPADWIGYLEPKGDSDAA